jgi:hypothetical protein
MVGPVGYDPTVFRLKVEGFIRLSYRPEIDSKATALNPSLIDFSISTVKTIKMVDQRGFEPLTLSLQRRRTANCATGPKIKNVYILY